jgi:hypothetical protein
VAGTFDSALTFLTDFRGIEPDSTPPTRRFSARPSVRWRQPAVSAAGVQQYGQDYWQDFLDKASIIGIVCQR